ncbi:hypothetical protein JW872_00240 [Candidatus Babeliales bacterium]|nr:hypothetical protein [Candidatus Babeliales bacterium]
MLSKLSKIFSRTKKQETPPQPHLDQPSSGKLTLKDFVNQMNMISKMGSLSKVLKYMPGLPKDALSPEVIKRGEEEMKIFKAIIEAMDPAEQMDHRKLTNSRKREVARQAGVTVSDIDRMLARFEQSQQYAKLFRNNKGFPKI